MKGKDRVNLETSEKNASTDVVLEEVDLLLVLDCRLMPHLLPFSKFDQIPLKTCYV